MKRIEQHSHQRSCGGLRLSRTTSAKMVDKWPSSTFTSCTLWFWQFSVCLTCFRFALAGWAYPRCPDAYRSSMSLLWQTNRMWRLGRRCRILPPNRFSRMRPASADWPNSVGCPNAWRSETAADSAAAAKDEIGGGGAKRLSASRPFSLTSRIVGQRR